MEALETKAIHAGWDPDDAAGSLTVPLHTAASFKLPGFGSRLFRALQLEAEDVDHVYSRWSNPTLRALEQRLAALEGSESAVVFASGMAAVSALFLTFLSAGDHIVASDVCYAGTQELLGLHLPRFGIQVSLVDTSDLAQVSAALQANTRLVFVETPANPTLRLADLSALAKLAHGAGALLAVDSTYATPLLQQPLQLGADFVLHSLTKYIAGHCDALGGAVLGSRQACLRLRREMLVHLGGAMSPFNAWQILRGLETLAPRLQQHCQSAGQIAEFLHAHPQVARVYYPGLPDHPQHALAARQMSGYGGMIAFTLKGGLAKAIAFAEKIRVITYATSLGHPQSLVFYYPYDLYVAPAAYLGVEQKRRIHDWMGEGLVRLSVGLEDVNDLIADLDAGLRARSFKGMVGEKLYGILKKG